MVFSSVSNGVLSSMKHNKSIGRTGGSKEAKDAFILRTIVSCAWAETGRNRTDRIEEDFPVDKDASNDMPVCLGYLKIPVIPVTVVVSRVYSRNR